MTIEELQAKKVEAERAIMKELQDLCNLGVHVESLTFEQVRYSRFELSKETQSITAVRLEIKL